MACKSGQETEPHPAPATTPADELPTIRDGVPRSVWRGIGSHTALVDWVSIDGRYVLAWVFDRDTDGSGEVEVAFGQHGEAEGDAPTRRLYDTREDRQIVVAEVAGADAERRLLTFRREGKENFEVLNAPAGIFHPLSVADSVDDGNVCLPPRAVAYADGRVSRILSGSQVVEVADARKTTREATRYTFENEKVWRAEPEAAGWLRVRLVADGASFPRAKTTCSCAWCPGMASSLGHYGWSDAWREELVHVDGHRVVDEVASLQPLSAKVFWNTRRNRLVDLKGAEIAVPRGCALRQVTPGAPQVLLTCGGDLRLWHVDSDETDDVEDAIRPLGRLAPARGAGALTAQVVRVVGPEGPRIGGWRAPSTLLVGPRADRMGALHPSGWVLGATRDDLSLFHIESGATLTWDELPAPPATLSGLSARIGDRWWVFDPDRGLKLERNSLPRWITDRGCFLVSERDIRDGLSVGPFEVICLEAPETK